LSTDSPTPETKSARDFWARYKGVIRPLAAALLAGVVSSLLTYFGAPPKIVESVTEVIKYVEAPPAADAADPHAFGWVEDAEQIATNLDPARTLHFATTPAGRAVMGDEDVFTYRTVRKVAKLPADRYPNINQGNVGSCVGAATKHGFDIAQAGAIASGEPFDWKPASAEVVYAMSRIDVGRGQIRGDGSLGRWACDAAKLGALAPMERIGAHDLSAYSAARARDWGARGVPAEVKAVAKNHPVKGAALVRTAAEVKRALAQVYPVVVCSTVGFDDASGRVGTRDAQGFIRPRGTWPHAMCFIAWRAGPRAGALCLNSWGDRAHGGPVWPEDMPVAAFWVDEAVVERMVSQGDSFALSDVQGFPQRNPKPDWFVQATARPARELLRADLFALAP
jgi:hypothetical protein